MNWQEKMKLSPTPITGKCDCSPEEVGYDSSRIELLDKHIQSMIERGIIRSGSYCLSRNGNIFANKALGALACEWQGRTHLMPDAFIDLQSVTKMMTAVAMLKLVEDGMLHLEQPVHEWIEEFRTGEFRNITLLHCLTHTSGLVGVLGTHGDEDVDWTGLVEKEDVEHTWISAIVRAGLRRSPGEEWSYSMAGFLILGEIIKRATGMRAEDFIRQTILIPCQMPESHWRAWPREMYVNRYNIVTREDVDDVKRYEREGALAFAKTVIPGSDVIPCTAGGLMCPAEELIRFGQMLLNGGSYQGKRIIGRKAVEYLWTNMVDERLRDFCWDHPGNRVIYGAGVPMFRQAQDRQQIVSDHTIYHEGHGACMLLIDKEEKMVAVYQTQFTESDKWHWEAVKATTSVIWSGIR